MNEYYFKIFSSKEANILEYLKLSEYLRTHSLIEETHIVLDNVIELENHSQVTSYLLYECQRKYEEMMKRLISSKKREGED